MDGSDVHFELHGQPTIDGAVEVRCEAQEASHGSILPLH